MNHTDRILPTNKGLTTYVDELLAQQYQIPTFQREVVWEKENVKKLWDSIYKFYPLGSILVWRTDLKLHNHRQIGGHVIADNGSERREYLYILDGQQRTTSILTSLHGGSIAGQPGFDPTLYVDLTVPSDEALEGSNYRDRFLFANEIDDRGGELIQNRGRQKRFQQGLVIKLLDILKQYDTVQAAVFRSELVGHDFDHPVMKELRKVHAVLTNYRLSFIEIKGIAVAEVCQIFERINQAGKPLDIFDIVVAKTFVPASSTHPGFYLRELFQAFKQTNNSPFLGIGDTDLLQMVAVIMQHHLPDSPVKNITNRYLNEVTTEHLEAVWPDAQKAILKTFDFFENHLHLHTPYLIPYRYFYLSITAYLFRNDRPDYALLKRYFWHVSFHKDDLLTNTTQLRQHIDFLNSHRIGETPSQLSEFAMDRAAILGTTYSMKGRLSRAMLALYASKRPKDWAHPDKDVLARNLFFSNEAPNLHHFFPTQSDFIREHASANRHSVDSLLNVVYLPQITNLKISNRNPLEYLRDFAANLSGIHPSHLLSEAVLGWLVRDELPPNALDAFIEIRLEEVVREVERLLKTGDSEE